jgi:DNA-binding MarR family transcriptional regulator
MTQPQHDSNTNEHTLEQADRLRLATARLARRLRQQAGTGLTPSQASALMSIDKHGPLTLGQLARIEQIAPPTTTGIVAKLEDDGLVRREAAANDRRSVLVEATAEGRRRLDHSRRRRSAWLAERLATFDADQRADLTAALRVLEALAVDPDADADPGQEPGPEPAPAATAAAGGEPGTPATAGDGGGR